MNSMYMMKKWLFFAAFSNNNQVLQQAKSAGNFDTKWVKKECKIRYYVV